MNTAATPTFTIQLPQFQGPFDLLLFFIERDELDIHDIPIAQVTNDFLDYTHAMQELNIDLASEFILVAATLCRIKSKLLLPRKALDEDGQEIDPRQELIERLLEYKKYKSVLDQMRALESQRSQKHCKGNFSKQINQIATKALVDIELEDLTLFKLLKTYTRLLNRYEDKSNQVIHKVRQYPYTIQSERERFLKSLDIDDNRSLQFEHIFAHCNDRIHAIVVFLALLELLNLSTLALHQKVGTNNFTVSRGMNFDAKNQKI